MLYKRFKVSHEPRLQNLISYFTSLRKYSNEDSVDYIIKAEDMQLNFFEVDKSICEENVCRKTFDATSS